MSLVSKKAVAHLERDTRFREIIKSTKLKRRPSDGDVYSMLVRTIIYQQLSGKAAATIHARFLQLFKDGYPHAAELAKMKTGALRNVGLSGQKSDYVRNVAKFWIAQQLDHQCDWRHLTDEEIIAILTKIKGVGTWSVQMILMFTLKRPDVFPLNDLGIRNAMVKRYRLRSKGRKLDDRLTTIAYAWRPYRTLACLYLWQWLDN